MTASVACMYQANIINSFSRIFVYKRISHNCVSEWCTRYKSFTIMTVLLSYKGMLRLYIKCYTISRPLFN